MQKKMNGPSSVWLKFWLGLICLCLVFILAMVVMPKKILQRAKLYIHGPEVPIEKVNKQVDPSFNRLAAFDSFVKELEVFKDDEDIGEEAGDILARQSQYKAFLSENLVTLPKASIDFIAQSHFNDFDPNNRLNKQIVKSQEDIFKFLNAKGYDLVAAEGFSSNRLDKESFDKESYDSLMRKRNALERAKLASRYRIDFTSFESFKKSPFIAADNPFAGERFNHDGAMRYGAERPSAVIGAEDQFLIGLHHRVLEVLHGGILGSDPRKERMFFKLSPLASEIRLQYAYAKLIHGMKQQGAKSGVIVYGFGHAQQFKKLAEKLGQNSVIYNFSGGLR